MAFTRNGLLLALHILELNYLLTKASICTKDVCEYHFDIRWSQTMSYYEDRKGFSVGLNGTKLQIIENAFRTKLNSPEYIGKEVSASEVNTADGYRRDVIVINGKFPGPTIEVMEGSQVAVHVINNLKLEAITLHWHGLHMTGTPFMDGAAFITQCPIQPGQRFTYRFKADPAGTHWYHSHLHQQVVAGAQGMLIVHQQEPKVPYFPVALTDWFHVSAATFDYSNVYMGGIGGDIFLNYQDRAFAHDNAEVTALDFHSALLNGRGRYRDTDRLPLEEFVVNEGQRHRFRMVNMAAEFFFEVSIDGHEIEIVALDGHDIDPQKTDRFIIGTGERVDFEITADQKPESYWLRANTLRHGSGQFPTADDTVNGVKGIVRYSATGSSEDPLDQEIPCTETKPCKVFNCAWLGYAQWVNKTCTGLGEANSSQINNDYGLDSTDVEEMFLNFAYAIGSSINARRFVMPEIPLLGQNSTAVPNRCQDTECANGCFCTHVLDLPLAKTMQFVLTNTLGGSTDDVVPHHTVHLHGYDFAVLKVGYPEYNVTTGFRNGLNADIVCNNKVCDAASWTTRPDGLNLANPPIKDTVIVPTDGYVIIRLKTRNPGYWLIHCHQVTHHTEGMAMVLNIGEDQHPPLPSDFPECNPFTFSEEQYQNYQSGNITIPSQPDNTPCLKDDQLLLSRGQAIGAAIGFVIAGLLLGLFVSVICVYCRSKTGKASLK